MYFCPGGNFEFQDCDFEQQKSKEKKNDSNKKNLEKKSYLLKSKIAIAILQNVSFETDNNCLLLAQYRKHPIRGSKIVIRQSCHV